MDLQKFLAKWSASGAAERANKDAFLLDLCDLLGVPRPDPATGDPERDLYAFERDAVLPHEGGRVTVGKIDLYKHECFLLEAKQGSEEGSRKIGAARRGTPAWNIAMRDAFGQALGYARTLATPPPFLLTCDIGYCFDLYATFDGSWDYRPFPDGRSSRIYFADLGQHIDRLQAVFLDPHRLDPSRHAAKVTREIAEQLATLARELEASGQDPEGVATFLMRCLFTLFAEDIGLLPDHLFTNALEQYWLPNPASFPTGVTTLWSAMNTGSPFGFWGKLQRFNGGLFAEQQALALTRGQLELLHEAARSSWSEVEPAIFGTLLERALNHRERHRLGAHYTPRAYVERLVRPTIEEPLRQDWDLVQAQVRKLVEGGRVEEAKKVIRTFHRRLTTIRVLDPACGSGNFLYVSLDLFKRLESEVLGLLRDLGETQDLLEIQGATVTPEQFRGIEVKPWAKEIAELVLWIGYLQWQVRTHGSAQAIPEPVLSDYGNIECRDAVLAHDGEELVRDERGVPVTRWDGETYKKSPVTGEDIPDESARIPVYRYLNPRKAEWPKADFIVGNPPFIGTRRMRLTLGDGYVQALVQAAPEVPENSDYVMYWWDKAADLVRGGKVSRFGMITTNSIVQVFNRSCIHRHLFADKPLSLLFAIPDHPWGETFETAAVRIAMTVGIGGDVPGALFHVIREEESGSETVVVLGEPRYGKISEDLRVGASPALSRPLRSNDGIAFWGVKFYGEGFIVSPDQVSSFRGQNPARQTLARPFVSGKDLTRQIRGLWAIDCNGLNEDTLADVHPAEYQWLLDRVKPVRKQNPRSFKRERWWIFGENQPGMRQAVQGCSRYIATTETSKHRVFHLLETKILAEGTVTVIALEDAFFFGVLSSHVHVTWALAAGGRLGVGNDPRYNKTRCFDPFPFPVCGEQQKAGIRELGEALDAHRKRQQAQHSDLTVTDMYNVLAKLRSGEPLTAKERIVHEHGLVSVLRQIHDDLDAVVLDAYGWPHDLTDEQILERLVALNAERTEEERNGIVRWLRPDFQNPSGAREATQSALPETEDVQTIAAAPAAAPWPKQLSGQISAVRDLLIAGGAWDVEQVARSFKGARRRDVAEVLESLTALGLAVSYETAGGTRWRGIERGVTGTGSSPDLVERRGLTPHPKGVRSGGMQP